MGLDIRFPISVMFTVLGVMLTLFGALGDKSIYARSLGININMLWGCVLLVFGITLLIAARRSLRKQRAEKN